jgi:hypothetical protein
MRNPLAFLIIGLFFGTGLGFLLAASQGVTLNGHDHADHSTAETHDHTPLQAVALADDGTAPTLATTLHPDAVSGWNLEIQTTRFQFTPESVNGENTSNTGHAHIYLDGVKLARTYGPWFHIATLESGDHILAVELNANDHSPLSINGTPIRVERTLTSP